MTHLDFYVKENLVFTDTSREFDISGNRSNLLIISPTGGDITIELVRKGEVEFSYKILDGEVYNANYIDCESLTIANPDNSEVRYERRLAFKKVI